MRSGRTAFFRATCRKLLVAAAVLFSGVSAETADRTYTTLWPARITDVRGYGELTVEFLDIVPDTLRRVEDVRLAGLTDIRPPSGGDFDSFRSEYTGVDVYILFDRIATARGADGGIQCFVLFYEDSGEETGEFLSLNCVLIEEGLAEPDESVSLTPHMSFLLSLSANRREWEAAR